MLRVLIVGKGKKYAALYCTVRCINLLASSHGGTYRSENATPERFQYTTDRPSLCKALIQIGFFSAVDL
jgi:hypothetical protein